MERLNDALGKLGLGRAAGKREVQERKHLVVDALNFLSYFCPSKEPDYAKSSPWTLHAVMQQRARAFLDGCKLCKLEPHFVFDHGYQSAEAMDKWKARREEEVLTEYRSMPCNVDVSLAAVLKEQGADVLQPVGLDADDVVARLALAFDGASKSIILSGDRDMLRYDDLDCKHDRIKENFAFRGDGCLVLISRRDFELRAEPRSACDVTLDLKAWRAPKLKTLAGASYVRGNSDSFTKSMGNLNVVARPLRQALYARLGLESVEETIPVFNKISNDVEWSKISVVADNSLDELLKNPEQAFQWLGTADKAPPMSSNRYTQSQCRIWRSYSQAMTVAEYCYTVQQANTINTNSVLIDYIHMAQSLDPNAADAHVTPWRIPDHMLETLCSRCGKTSNCVSGELEFLWSKGFSLPKLCKLCRKERQATNQRPQMSKPLR